MKCPICGTWSRVLETRGARRRRECANHHRFGTEELAIPDGSARNRAIDEMVSMFDSAQTERDATVRKARGTKAEIAARFGLSVSQIYRIKRRINKS